MSKLFSPLFPRLGRIVFGADPRLRRLLRYWLGTCLFYLLSMGVLAAEMATGLAPRGPGLMLAVLGLGGVVSFYLLVRFSQRLRLEPWQLALYQAVFALSCIIAGYVIAAAPMRGAILMLMLVVMVFCVFSLRPRQAWALGAGALVALGAAMYSKSVHDPVDFPPTVELLQFLIAVLCMIGVTALTGAMNRLRARLKAQKEELLRAVARIQTLATVDELTALPNRRHAHAMLSAAEERLAQAEAPLCMALLDIDFFKTVNDRFGHAGGDAVLRAFAEAARPEVRAHDLLARWGGEEFLLMLPDTQLADAERVLARMAQRFAEVEIAGLVPRMKITFSAGVVERRPGEALADSINRADRAMYVAKSTGRDRVIAG